MQRFWVWGWVTSSTGSHRTESDWDVALPPLCSVTLGKSVSSNWRHNLSCAEASNWAGHLKPQRKHKVPSVLP